jgi:hypothetical protein
MPPPLTNLTFHPGYLLFWNMLIRCNIGKQMILRGLEQSALYSAVIYRIILVQ